MIATGSKVIVVASSLKKTVGPRVGSVGYVITSNNGFFDNTTAMSYYHTNILFTRYGFEQTPRHEMRHVLNVLPFTMTNVKANKIVENVCRAVNTAKLDKGLWRDVIAEYFPDSNIAGIVITVPIQANKVNLSSCDNPEFCAWLDSHLQSPIFRVNISNALKKNCRNNSFPVGNDVIESLKASSQNKSYKRKLFERVNEGNKTANRELMIKCVRAIQSTQTRIRFKAVAADLDEIIAAGALLDNNGTIRNNVVQHRFLADTYIDIFQEMRYSRLAGLEINAVNKTLHKLTKIKEELRTFTETVLGERERTEQATN